MAKHPLPTPEELRQLLRYEPETGKLFWRERPQGWFENSDYGKCWNGRNADQEAFAGKWDDRGYGQGSLMGKKLLAHRVAFALYYGRWPDGAVDHINRDKSDNRISNLRVATKAQNAANTGPLAGTSSFRGVSARKRDGRWIATIVRGGKQRWLGAFKSEEDAARAYDRAAADIYGEYAFLNFPEESYGNPPRAIGDAAPRQA